MAIRVAALGTTVVKKIITGPSSGTTIVKKVTVGTPTKIGSVINSGAISTLGDVNGNVNRGEGTYLRFDSDLNKHSHKLFDSDVRNLISAGTGLTYNSSTGEIVRSPISINDLTDVDTTNVASNSILKFDTSSNKFVVATDVGGEEEGSSNFIALVDTPLNYVNSTNKIVRVNDSGNGIEFASDSDVFIGISSDLVPLTDSAFDLGDSDKRWKDLHLSGSTIFLGNIKLKDSGGNFVIKGTSDSSIGADLSSNTTSDLSEGSNLYYTEARFDARLGTKSTSDLSEGTNLYYTTARSNTDFDTRLGTTTTTSLAEGTNLYYTNDRFDARLGTKSTSDLSEGSNLYYTDTRADARAQLKIDALVDGAPGQLNTLNELAAAINDDSNFSSTITANIATKLAIANFDSSFDSALSLKSTTDLSEGSNLYHTGARAITAVQGTNLDMGSNNITTTGKILYANVYSTEGDLPSASTYHGMFAHVHGTGKAYFSHAGQWHKLLDETSSTTSNLSEGSNLYYTDTRFDSAFNAKSTSNLSEGSNLYYTNARVQTLIDSSYINFRTDANLDSSLTSQLIDSAYIQARQNNFVLDSASIAADIVTSTVDNAYVQARQIKYNTSDFTDSAFVTGLPVSTFTNDANYLDSNTVPGVVNASYIQANQTNFLDSSLTTQLINASYIQSNQTNFLDSSLATQLINASYIQSNQTDYLDSSLTSQLVDSSYVQLRVPASYIQSNQTDYLDSALTTQLVDSSYVIARAGASTDSAAVIDIIDSSYVQLRVPASYIQSNQTNFLDSALTTQLIDGSYIQSNQTNFLDSALTTQLISASYIQANQTDYLDSALTTQLINASYIQSNQTDYLDSALATQLIDTAYVKSHLQALDSSDNPTFNQLRGPAEFIIDPAAIGNNTGTVRILGNLTVDGTQTTVNSTAVSIADKNIVIAGNASDSSGLDGGGLTWGGSSIADTPTFNYSHSSTRFDVNRDLRVSGTGAVSISTSGNITVSGTVDGRDVATDGTKLDGIEASADVTDTTNVTAAGAAMLSGATFTGAVSGTSADFNSTVTAAGATFTGDVLFDGAVSGHDILFDRSENTLQFNDNTKAVFGTGSDLQIYHDGNHSYIEDAGDGELRLRGNASVKINQFNNNEAMAIFNVNGSVDLRYDNITKLETTSSGIDVTGNISVSGTVDGRDVATDGSKLDGIEASADVTDATNVTAAGAAMLSGAAFTGDISVTSGTNAKLTINDAISEVGSGNLALQTTNSAGSALKPMGFRAEDIRFATGSSERMRIDGSGRVGIGVSPETTSNGKSLTINRTVINDDDGGSFHISQNSYYNSAWKYVENGTAEKITFASGVITFDRAASNSSGADASLSWLESMRISSDGSVGIGDNNPPASVKLAVQADGIGIRLDGTANTTRSLFFRNTTTTNPAEIIADGSLRIRTEDASTAITFHTNSSGSNNERVRIDSSGNVGIANGDLTITSTDAASTTAGPVLTLARDGASPEDNDLMGQIVFKMDDDAGNLSTFARIEVVATDVSNGSEDARIDFIAAKDDSFSTGLSIAGQNVGIGTTSPDQLVHINKSSGTTLVKTEVASNSTVGFEIKKTGSTTSNWRIADGQTVNGKLEIFDVTDSRSIMTFDGDGNVGIGTISPNVTLTLSDGTDEFDFGVTTNVLTIKSVTSDGSDDQRIIIDAGNGGLSSTRGAYVALSGNEASSEAGKAIYQMGNVTGASHVFRKAGGNDAVTIDSSGNMGIGTSPSEVLTVQQNTADTYTPTSFNDKSTLSLKSQDGTGNYSGIRFTNTSGGYEFMFGSVQTSTSNDYADMVLQGYDWAATAYKEHLRVKNNGNIGINSDSPGAKLEIKQPAASVYNDNDGNALRLEYAGNPNAGDIGPMMTFAQHWYASSSDVIRTGGIAGIKTVGSGAYGGGLAFYAQPNSGSDMNQAMVINHLGNVRFGVGNSYSPTIQGITNNGRTEANPGYTFTDDLDTGMFNPATADTIAFATNGSERVRIDNSGNVGIGCTPDQKLHVKGTIETQATNSTNGWQLYTYTDNTFRVNYNGAGSDEVTITSSGLVGIGLTNPSDYYGNQLVVNTPNEGGITMVGPTSGEHYLMWADGTTGGEMYRGYIGYSHTNNYMRFATGSSERMRIDTNGYINVGSPGGNSTAIIQGTSGAGSTNQPGTDLQLKGGAGGGTGGSNVRIFTAPGGSSGTSESAAVERMRVRTNGNVGIAGETASAHFPLHVNKGTTTYGPTNGVVETYFGVNTSFDTTGTQGVYISQLDGNHVDGTSGGDYQYGLIFGYQDNIRGGLIYDIRGVERMALWSSYGRFSIMTPSSADADAVPIDSNMSERLTVLPGGNVGINKTDPSAKLDVVTNDNVYVAEFTQSNTSNGDGVFISVGSTASTDYALTVRSDAGNKSVLAAKADGDVGIGTFSPDAPLHVEFSNNNGGVGGQLIKNSNTGTTANFASLATGAVNSTVNGQFGSAHYPSWGGAVAFAGSSSNHPFKIVTNNTVRVTVDTSGNTTVTGAANAAALRVMSGGTEGSSFTYGNTQANMYFNAGGSGADAGMSFFNSAGNWTMQLYGYNNNSGTAYYGFLDANWSSWDIQKTPSGPFLVDEGGGLKRVLNEGNYASQISSLGTVGMTGLATFTGGVVIDGGSLNNPGGSDYNDATVTIRSSNNNDWSLVLNKHYSSATDYGLRIDVGSSATAAFRVSGSSSTVFNVAGDGDTESSGNMTASNFYANNYFRNNDAGEGLYNETTARHFFSASATYWHIVSSQGLVFYTEYNSTAGGSTGRVGYVYHDSSGFGLLNSAGNWTVQCTAGNNGVVLKHTGTTRLSTTTTGVVTAGVHEATSFTATSDLAKKENLEPVDNAVEKVKELTGYTYNIKETGKRNAGLIAQDVEKVLPEAVDGEEGEKTLDYNATIALLVNAVKEQAEQIEVLKARLEILES